MRNFLRPPTDAERRTRYPVRVLVAPGFEPDGVAHGPAENRQLLRWSEIAQVTVAEIGEPEGVRTVVYDLLTRPGAAMVILRMDADPGEAAMATARALEAGIGSARASAALKSLAADGLSAHWFPDLRAFEEDCLAELERNA